MPRLTADQWQEIRTERELGVSFGDLAAKFGIDKAGIVRRAKREGWGDGSDVAEAVRRKVTEKVTAFDPARKAATIEAAAELAADVVRQQRDDWALHRAHFGAVPDDLNAGKLGKVSAEMIAIRQKAERVAWGLDETENKPDITIQWAGLPVDHA